MASNICMTCAVPGVTENVLVCSGLCKKVAHYKCVGLRKNVFDVICGSDSIFWFCDSCKHIYNEQVKILSVILDSVKKIDSSMKTIEEKAQVNISKPVQSDTSDRITDDDDSLDSIVLPVADQTRANCTNMVTEEICIESGSKLVKSAVPAEIRSAKRNPQSSSRTLAEVVSFSPSSSVVVPTVDKKHPQHLGTRSICGTRHFAENFGVKVTVPTLWLHLSKFDPETSENEISSMAKTCLEIEECKAFKLVPKLRNSEGLEFVCFKLGIKADLRLKALDPNTWPTGVHIREFNNKNFRTTLPPRVKFRTTATVNNSTR